MAVSVGSVHVEVVPSTEAFVRDMKRQILSEADKIGEELGRRIGREAAEAAARPIAEGIEEGIEDADTEASAGKKGKESGGAFARQFKASIAAALRDLPKVDLKVDDSELTSAQRELKELRRSLTALQRKNIGVNLDGEGAFAELSALRVALDSLRDGTVEIDFDVDRAQASLASLQRQVARDLGGTFDNTLRDSVANAVRDLPKIDLDVENIDPVRRTLGEIRNDIASLSDELDLDIDIDSADALARIEELRARLQTLVDDKNINIKVRADAAAAIARLTQVNTLASSLDREVDVRVDVRGGFADKLRSSIETALRALPNGVVDVDVDTDGGTAALALLRAELEAFGDLEIDVDLDANQALAEVTRLSAQFKAIADDETLNFRARFDAAQALVGLGAISAAAEKLRGDIQEVEREAGSFARSLRTQFEAAIRNLPDIEVNADTSQARRALQDIRENLAAVRDLEIDVDLSEAEALEGLRRLEAQLRVLATSAEIDVRANSRAVLSDLAKIRSTIEAASAPIDIPVEVKERNPGKFITDLRATLAKAQAALPDIEVDASTDPAQRAVRNLRRDIGALAATLDVDTDITAAMAQLAVLRAEAARLNAQEIDIRVDADVAAALAALTAVRAATAATEAAAGRLSRIRLILAAILLLFPLIAGAVAALASAIALILTPILAVAAGFEGIKRAVEPLRDEFDALRESVAGAFERGLAPAVARATALFPAFTAGLTATAGALSEVTTEIVDVVAEADSLRDIETNFDLINDVIRSLSPSFQQLATNFTAFVRIGGEGLNSFGVEMVEVGNVWNRVISRLDGDSEVGQAAVRAFFQILAEILGLLGPLTEFGSVLLATFGPAISGALSVLSVAFEAFSAVLSSIPGPIQTVVTATLLLSATFAIIGRTLPLTAAAMTRLNALFPALAASTGAAAVAARGFLAVVGGPIGLAIIGVVTALSLLGQANSAAAEETAAHQAAVQSLGDALEESNGIITDNISNLTEKSLIDAGATETANALGLSTREITDAITAQGPEYDNLISRLQAFVTAGDAASLSASATGIGLDESAAAAVRKGQAAQELLGIITPLGDEFQVTSENIRLYQEALGQSTTSTVAGVANALQLSGALATLGKESSTTSEKVAALTDALDALNGGQLTAEEAAANLREEIAGIGEAFTEAAAATAEAGVSLVMANGAIDNTTEKGRELLNTTLSIRDGMLESATAAFDAAGGLTNVGLASEAAAGEVQLARDAFIGAAREAGLSADAAGRLADRYGLIPSLVTTLLRAEGIDTVTGELQQIAARIEGIPEGRTVSVGVISDEAVAVLDAIGAQIQVLPDGEVLVTATDATADGIAAALGFINSQQGDVQVGADDAQLLAAIPALLSSISAQRAEVTIAGNTLPALEALGLALQSISQGRADVEIGGVTQPLDFVLAEALSTIAASSAPITIDGNPVPANQVIDALIDAVVTGNPIMTIQGNPTPTSAVIDALIGAVVQANPTMTINPRDLVTAVINVLKQPTSSTHTINVVERRTTIYSGRPGGVGGVFEATGGILMPMASGGVLPKNVGGQRLSPMAGGRARVVAPNTWRVIGDNLRSPEAYIPLDGSARSFGFARQAVNSFGYDVTPMATGGLIESARRLTLAIAPSRTEVRPQQVRTVDTFENVSRGPAGALAGSRRVEQQLAKIAELLEARQQQVPPITVEDRSGDSVQTARAVQLALRMSR